MKINRCFSFIVLLFASIGVACGEIQFRPANDSIGVCVDSPLQITFDSAPVISGSGSIRIFNDNGAPAETIDTAIHSRAQVVGGVLITNYPVMVSGNTAFIYPRETLERGKSYYVTVESNVFRTAKGPFDGITEKSGWSFKTKTAAPKSGTTNFVVAADGSGDFCTIQGAIDFLPSDNNQPVLISIRNGVYREIIHVNAKHKITFRGEDRKQTLITYPNNAKLNDSTFRAMFNVAANNITIENLTLHNSTPSGGSQAEALRVNGERCILKDADFLSFQDTLQLTGSIYAENCFVAGDVDFIWGSGAAYFTNCEIKTLKRNKSGANGYIVQSRNRNTNFGYVFVDCKLTAETGTSNQILARIEADRFPDSHVAFINCAMGDHIKPEGWLLTTKTNPNAKHALRFWEYQSTDLTGTNLLDVSARHPASRQLTSEEAAQMRDAAHVFAENSQPGERTRPACWFGRLAQTFVPHIDPKSEAETEVSQTRFSAGRRKLHASGVRSPATREIPAFPGAEGFAANITGGRGGRVIAVTNLNDSGPGSLRDAVKQKGARTIVFRVSGTIALQSPLELKHGDVTIAGQTAPGDGICLKNYNLDISDVKNAVVRFLRIRPGDAANLEIDGLTGANFEDVIIDHCSVSWGIDECLSLYRGRNLTVQWTLVSESLWASKHRKGNHGYGGIWGGTNASWHHNLIAHHSSRNPRFSRDGQNVDFRNNVIYNWGFNSIYGGERSTINLINNFLKAGPATEKKCVNRIVDAGMEGSRWFISGNHVAGFPEISANNWNGVHNAHSSIEKLRADGPFPFAPVETQFAERAYELVLKNVGAILPRRDTVDLRVIEEVRTGTAKFGETYRGGGNGIINSQETVGGWPELKSSAPPLDTDGDGMPDDWEEQFGLNSNDPSDGAQDKDSDGYTNLEEYLNGTNPNEFVDYTRTENSRRSSQR